MDSSTEPKLPAPVAPEPATPRGPQIGVPDVSPDWDGWEAEVNPPESGPEEVGWHTPGQHDAPPAKS